MVFSAYWPTEPVAALSFVAVPTILGVVSVGEVPNTSEPDPVSSDITPSNCADVVDANCDRFPEVSANVLPQLSPVPLVYLSALLAVLQLGTENATGDALEPVKLLITVFAATGASAESEILAHVGAELGPLDVITCPDVDPVGLSN